MQTDTAMEEARAIADVIETIANGRFYDDYDQASADLRILREAATAIASKDAEIERLTKEKDANHNLAVANGERAKEEYCRAEKAERALAGGVKVKALDFSTVLRHAFLSGVAAARSISANEECIGPDLWLQYEPYEPGAYSRILAALEPAAPDSGQEAEPDGPRKWREEQLDRVRDGSFLTRPAEPAVTEEQVEAAAKVITKWLGFAWDGLRYGRVVDRGFPVFLHHSQTGWKFQGHKGDMIDIARAALTAALSETEGAS